MKRRTHRFRPEAAPLEARALLSVGAPAPEAGQMAILDAPGRVTLPLEVERISTIPGHYAARVDNRAADAPLALRIDGRGSVDDFGRGRLTGTLDLGGFRAAGAPDVSGTLTLANARGTIRFQVSGTGGAQALPGAQIEATLTVVRGTGAYRGMTQTGTITLAFGPNQVRSHGTAGALSGAATLTFGFPHHVGS